MNFTCESFLHRDSTPTRAPCKWGAACILPSSHRERENLPLGPTYPQLFRKYFQFVQPSPPQRYYIYRAPEAPSEGELKVPVKAAGSRLRHKGAAEELPLSE